MSRSAFDRCWASVLGFERGFSDDPADSGGATRFGVTEAVARAHGYRGPMEEMPIDVAAAIARDSYWDRLRLDDIAPLSEDLALELLDTGYNCGVVTAAKFLQRALNVLNRLEADYEDIAVDGVLGQASLGALRAYLGRRASRGLLVLLRALNCLQGAYYIELGERRAKDERFVFGWLLNRVGALGGAL